MYVVCFFFSSAKWQSRSTEKQIQSIKIYILVPALELSLIRHLLRKNKNRTLKDADKFLQFKNRRRHKTKTRLITYTRRSIYAFCCYLITQPVGALFLDFFFSSSCPQPLNLSFLLCGAFLHDIPMLLQKTSRCSDEVWTGQAWPHERSPAR